MAMYRAMVSSLGDFPAKLPVEEKVASEVFHGFLGQRLAPPNNSIEMQDSNKLASVSSPSESDDRSGWETPEKLVKVGEKPPIYSENRQELCEALPYFRSFQGGHYISNGRTLGYLLDGYPAPRDVFEDSGRVIISHGGGGSKMLCPSASGCPAQYILLKSQTIDGYRVRALRKCHEQQIPVVLLAGTKYSAMPWIRNYGSVGFVVLGHYLVTHYWPERESRIDLPGEYCVRFKFRFQWMSSQGDPWWLQDLQKYCTLQSTLAKVSYKVHDNHHPDAPQTSMTGFDRDFQQTTLNLLAAGSSQDHQEWNRHNSVMFWNVQFDQDATESGREEFHSEEENANPLDQQIDDMEIDDVEIEDYECDICQTRSLYIYECCWMCLNEQCSEFFKLNKFSAYGVNQLNYLPGFLRHQHYLETQQKVPFQLKPITLQNLTQDQLLDCSRSKNGFYCSDCGRLSRRIYWGALICCNDECQFQVELPRSTQKASELPSVYRTMHVNNFEWFILHATPSESWVKAKASRLLEELQSCLDPLSFKRNKLRDSRVDGMVAQAFTLNFGHAYKYCTEIDTISWKAAPVPVLTAFSKLCRIVEALSSIALDKLGHEPLPQKLNELLFCCYFPGSGMNYHSDNERGLGSVIATISLGSAAIMNFKRKIHIKPLNPGSKRCNPPILQLLVEHGDIVLQVGSEIQQKYLHCVHTDGFRISATARQIDPINME